MPPPELDQFGLRNIQIREQLAVVGNDKRGVAFGQAAAQLHLPRGDHAVDRRTNFSVFPIQTSQLVGGLARARIVDQRFILGATDQPAIVQICKPFDFTRTPFKLGPQLEHRQPEALAVEPGQDITLRYGVAFLDQYLDHIPGGAGRDRRLGVGCQRAGRLVSGRDVCDLGVSHRDRQRRRLDLRNGFSGVAVVAARKCERE